MRWAGAFPNHSNPPPSTSNVRSRWYPTPMYSSAFISTSGFDFRESRMYFKMSTFG